ncbi:MAG: TonB C-terminal domain-containing protein [Heliobacteriaceae bacterium]|nr:TonB C-terminal domain-containing protein [Heliobacteriaceae bacterium]
MEIKNQNIYLNENEEVYYIAQKDKLNFWCSFVVLTVGLLICGSFTIFLTIVSVFYSNIVSVKFPLTEGMAILAVCVMFCCLLYKEIADYFFTELILTNQRLIISRFNKIRFIDNNRIKCIKGMSLHYPLAPMILDIRLKNKKRLQLYFIELSIIKTKFQEVCPDYDDSRETEKERKWGTALIIILIITSPFFWYLHYKFLSQKNNNKSYRTAQHQNSNEPYFDTYMTNLQNKIKRNWKPPKNKENYDIILQFKVDRSGNVSNIKILKASDDKEVNKSAVNALLKSAPFESLPIQHKENTVNIQFTFNYNAAKAF